MQTRLLIVAIVAFALGVAADRFARVSSYDKVIGKMGQTIETQRKLIDELQTERTKTDATPEESK